MVLPDPSTVETLSDQVKDLTSLSILTYMELWYELPLQSRGRVPLNSNVK